MLILNAFKSLCKPKVRIQAAVNAMYWKRISLICTLRHTSLTMRILAPPTFCSNVRFMSGSQSEVSQHKERRKEGQTPNSLSRDRPPFCAGWTPCPDLWDGLQSPSYPELHKQNMDRWMLSLCLLNSNCISEFILKLRTHISIHFNFI